jgi:hypothetical protein
MNKPDIKIKRNKTIKDEIKKINEENKIIEKDNN